MSIDEIQHVVIGVLRDVQTLSGRACTKLGPATKPIGDLDGFESLNGVEATVMLESELGHQLGVESVFVTEDGRRAHTVVEVARQISKLLAATGVKS